MVPHEPYLRLWLYSLLDSAAYLEWWPSAGAKVTVGLFVEARVKFRSRALNKGKGFEAWPCGKVTTRNKITLLWVRHTQLMNKKEKGVEERVDILLELVGIGVCLPESLVTYICLLPVALLEPEDLKKNHKQPGRRASLVSTSHGQQLSSLSSRYMMPVAAFKWSVFRPVSRTAKESLTSAGLCWAHVNDVKLSSAQSAIVLLCLFLPHAHL